MITNACRDCENWDEKDMLYATQYVNKSSLKSLWLAYGDCFCADKETYERIKDTISSGINNGLLLIFLKLKILVRMYQFVKIKME